MIPILAESIQKLNLDGQHQLAKVAAGLASNKQYQSRTSAAAFTSQINQALALANGAR